MEKFQFSESTDDCLKKFKQAVASEMEECVKHFEKELVKIRTGRATVSMLDGVKVESYGQLMQLRELATLSAPDARLLTIQPWDKSVIGDIERAITASDLGLAPVNDGKIIRLQLPIMSSERRDELAKILKKRTEEARVTIRNVRKEFHNQVRDAWMKNHDISEDFGQGLTEELQKVTDQFIDQVNSMQEKKEQSLRLA